MGDHHRAVGSETQGQVLADDVLLGRRVGAAVAQAVIDDLDNGFTAGAITGERDFELSLIGVKERHRHGAKRVKGERVEAPHPFLEAAGGGQGEASGAANKHLAGPDARGGAAGEPQRAAVGVVVGDDWGCALEGEVCAEAHACSHGVALLGGADVGGV